MNNKEKESFVAYEYLQIEINSKMEPLYVDCYENFGWKLISNTNLNDEDYITNDYYKRKISLKFKRNCKIEDKKELNTIEEQLNTSLKDLEKLEDEPKERGLIYSIAIGLFGILYIVVAIFSIIISKPLYFLSLISGIIGMSCLVSSYFIYKRIKYIQEKENIDLIKQQYDVIYELCEKAYKITNKEFNE